MLLSALEVGGSISNAIGDCRCGVGATRSSESDGEDDEERRWFELAAAMATNRLKGHSEATQRSVRTGRHRSRESPASVPRPYLPKLTTMQAQRRVDAHPEGHGAIC